MIDLCVHVMFICNGWHLCIDIEVINKGKTVVLYSLVIVTELKLYEYTGVQLQ